MAFARLLAAGLTVACMVTGAPQHPRFTLLTQHPAPVITTRSAGAEGNKYGFEGGRVIKVGGTYHLFTSEMVGDPIWVRMALAHWRSTNGLQWTRVSTLFQSTGTFDGKDPRAALWSPLPVYDDRQGRWNLFYVAYKSAPNTDSQFRMNHHGRIWRAISRTAGPRGIAGPYRDVGVVLEPGPQSEQWEGLQGTASFFPYQVGAQWAALYGSAKTERLPVQHWLVGVASAPSLSGPWRRRPEFNPAPIETRFIENPIVTTLKDGTFVAVYDSSNPDTIGYSFSRDGFRWSAGQQLLIQPTRGKWSADVRTPLGLVEEGGGVFTVFYTGFEQPPDWTRLFQAKPINTCAIGMAKVKLDATSGQPAR